MRTRQIPDAPILPIHSEKEPDRPTGSFLISAESVKLQKAQILFAFFLIEGDRDLAGFNAVPEGGQASFMKKAFIS